MLWVFELKCQSVNIKLKQKFEYKNEKNYHEKKLFTLLSYHWDCLNFPFNILHKEGHQKVLPDFGNVNSFE